MVLIIQDILEENKMKFYVYTPDENCNYPDALKNEPVGTFGKMMFELKTTNGAINRCNKGFGSQPFLLYSYTNFYDNKTFKLVYEKSISG